MCLWDFSDFEQIFLEPFLLYANFQYIFYMLSDS